MAENGKYAVAVKVHVSEETARRLRILAEREDRSINWLLRRMIDEDLTRRGVTG